jgi:outer membrane receptor protein involved in Fe transport
LPYASGNPVSLALTMPGITTSKYATPTATFVVNGGRGRSNNFMIDGTDNNDISIAGQLLTIINPSSVQEVSVQTSNYDAEFGRAGGAVVNVITRSGNEYAPWINGLCSIPRAMTRFELTCAGPGDSERLKFCRHRPAI